MMRCSRWVGVATGTCGPSVAACVVNFAAVVEADVTTLSSVAWREVVVAVDCYPGVAMTCTPRDAEVEFVPDRGGDIA